MRNLECKHIWNYWYSHIEKRVYFKQEGWLNRICIKCYNLEDNQEMFIYEKISKPVTSISK